MTGPVDGRDSFGIASQGVAGAQPWAGGTTTALPLGALAHLVSSIDAVKRASPARKHRWR